MTGPSGYVNVDFTKVILRPIKRLNQSKIVSGEVYQLLFIVVEREFNIHRSRL